MKLTLKVTLIIGSLLVLGPRPAAAEWAGPLYWGDIAIFPHLVGVADTIFTGTVVATNGYDSADFVVDEVIWGGIPGTNVTVRDFNPEPGIPYSLGEKYLVGAFTNDWWKGAGSFGQDRELLRYVPATNRPPSGRLLDGYRLVERWRSAIPFERICYGGTNYWEGTRTLITNLIDVGRVQCDEEKVREIVMSIIKDKDNSRKLPSYVRRQTRLYLHFRYDVPFDAPL